MKKQGFTLVEVLIVVAILALLAAVGIPSFMNSRQGAGEGIRNMNVASVEAAKEQWAIMNNKTPGSAVTWNDIEEYMGAGVDDQSDLDVDGVSITLNTVGNKAYY